ncbi:hypothetical protein DBV08_18270 [Rhodococcus sp. KBW08]|uniref:DUF3311 domain-containing protein n=1 Tax=Rhodococcus sp. KBW08 TaxID=2144188 RepID=UPI000F5A6CD3|nr:DUF3311 domain-containing protein [Rhodococcus sp. KBW08]RQO46089.1 hypothetical protein DBV08_18270 [Rhodococcus sp. KBW08]
MDINPSSASPPDTSTAPQLSWGKKILCGLLVLTPVVLALSVPLYQRVEPTLGGIPFFYWFQMTMAIAAACGCGATYFIAFRHETEVSETQ